MHGGKYFRKQRRKAGNLSPLITGFLLAVPNAYVVCILFSCSYWFVEVLLQSCEKYFP